MRLTHEGDLNLITDGKSINFGADSEIQLINKNRDTGLKINIKLQQMTSLSFLHCKQVKKIFNREMY